MCDLSCWSAESSPTRPSKFKLEAGMATEEQIRNYAHLLWEKAGRPEGRAEEFWHAAEVELNSESESPDAPTEETSGDETKGPTSNEQASKLTRGDQSQLPTVTTMAHTTEAP